MTDAANTFGNFTRNSRTLGHIFIYFTKPQNSLRNIGRYFCSGGCAEPLSLHREQTVSRFSEPRDSSQESSGSSTQSRGSLGSSTTGWNSNATEVTTIATQARSRRHEPTWFTIRSDHIVSLSAHKTPSPVRNVILMTFTTFTMFIHTDLLVNGTPVVGENGYIFEYPNNAFDFSLPFSFVGPDIFNQDFLSICIHDGY